MPANLVVARARMAGGIELEPCAPAELEMDAGDELLVKVPFRFDEMERRREDYDVLLTTRLDDEPPVEHRVEGRDIILHSDDKRGYALARHQPLIGGTHHLHFHVALRLATGDWSGDDETTQQATCEGDVVINVR